LLYFIHSG
jgi:hypothetical protein